MDSGLYCLGVGNAHGKPPRCSTENSSVQTSNPPATPTPPSHPTQTPWQRVYPDGGVALRPRLEPGPDLPTIAHPILRSPSFLHTLVFTRLMTSPRNSSLSEKPEPPSSGPSSRSCQKESNLAYWKKPLPKEALSHEDTVDRGSGSPCSSSEFEGGSSGHCSRARRSAPRAKIRG